MVSMDRIRMISATETGRGFPSTWIERGHLCHGADGADGPGPATEALFDTENQWPPQV